MKRVFPISLFSVFLMLFAFADQAQAYYAPSTGRFINRDPVAEQGGINVYSFVRNDGVNQWDVLGNAPGQLYDNPSRAFLDAKNDVVNATGVTVTKGRAEVINNKALVQILQKQREYKKAGKFSMDYAIKVNKTGILRGTIYGVEHGTLIYCIMKGGQKKYSYTQIEIGTLPELLLLKGYIWGQLGLIEKHLLYRGAFSKALVLKAIREAKEAGGVPLAHLHSHNIEAEFVNPITGASQKAEINYHLSTPDKKLATEVAPVRICSVTRSGFDCTGGQP